MKTTPIVLTLIAVLACCLVLACAALFAAGTLSLPDFSRALDPTPHPAPTAALTIPDPATIPASTLNLLLQTRIPENDPAAIVTRLNRVNGPIPETVPAQGLPLSAGTTQSFWAKNTDSNEFFRVQATLRFVTDHLYFWVQDGVRVNMDELSDLAIDFETHIYPTVRDTFGSEWSPGIDEDPHIYVLYVRGLGNGLAGYFSSADELHPLVHEFSNAHEMFFLNADNLDLDEAFTAGVLAHEFQHMIAWHIDPNEETWVGEGLSEVAALLTGTYNASFDQIYTSSADIPLTIWPPDGPRRPHYGGAFLFFTYFLDRYGEEATRLLAADPANGFTALDNVLVALGQIDPLRNSVPTSADVFQDFAAALYLQDPKAGDGRFAFEIYDAPHLDPTETIRDCPTGPQQRDVHQFGIDAIRITCRGSYTLIFQGSTAVPLLPVDPYSGRRAFWSNRGDQADITLTREFDFTGESGPLTLEYRLWYDIEEGYDYAYIMASTDGEIWRILQTPRGTPDNPSGNSYGWAYSGQSGGWLLETVDLSAYAGERVWLRFEYITDAAVVQDGLLLDDIAIPETGYTTDFEEDDGGWQADGFVLVENLLPQFYLLTLITFGDDGITVDYLDPDADNRIDIPLQIGEGVDEVVLLVSAATRFTAQKSGYTFEVAP